MSEPTNHKEAIELACYKREHSNLARCYLDLYALLDTVWHAMNDDNPPDFPMQEIEAVLAARHPRGTTCKVRGWPPRTVNKERKNDTPRHNQRQ